MPVKVKSKMVCPVRQKDGSWTTVIKHFEEDIPDLGRHLQICNKCGMKNYPDCIPDCPIEKSWKDFEAKHPIRAKV